MNVKKLINFFREEIKVVFWLLLCVNVFVFLFVVCGKDGSIIGCLWGYLYNGFCCWNSRYCVGIIYLFFDVFFDNYLIWGVFRKLL